MLATLVHFVHPHIKLGYVRFKISRKQSICVAVYIDDKFGILIEKVELTRIMEEIMEDIQIDNAQLSLRGDTLEDP